MGIGLLACIIFGIAAAGPSFGQGKGGKKGGGKNDAMNDPATFYFEDYDTDHDGRLDRSEWGRRGNFERLDKDKNGTIELRELRVLYEDWGKKAPMSNPILPSAVPEMDSTVNSDRLSPADVGQRAVCIVVRLGIMGVMKCSGGDALAAEHGLFETGIGPVFPEGAFCNGIDEIFGLDYKDKTGTGAHGGIDLPTDFGTPMLAVAAGTVVGVFEGRLNARGITLVLRHSPDDTGLPFWTYTEYAHMNAVPNLKVGQRVRMGEILGPTGNSGLSAKNTSGINNRRPGLHFAVYYSETRRYAEVQNYVIPENPRWMDSNAFYRKSGPYDSQSLKALPEAEKGIPIPIMYLDGTTEPVTTKMIWPYACKRT